ncbi:MAG TPA: chemotaxis response regulator protein-glutamate methylesterase [Polyangia bacterium]|nr:chemotaxis response regulator protein-glutamate methylesterase [Polyangia bacterium]
MINVLIVDDSLFMRQAVRRILSADARLRVIGEARDGTEGVEQVIRLQPDVVTMDFNMPGLTGAEAVREIMRLRPTPIVMLSAHTQAGARETLEALAAGAVDFLPKPSGEVSADFSRIQNALVQKVLAAAQAHPRVQLPVTPPPARPIGRTTWPASGPRVVVIAVSTGGPAALGRFLPALPGDTPFGLVVVQHMPAEFTRALGDRLNAMCALEVREAREGDRPRQARVLIAPGDRHLEFADGGSIRLSDGPEVNGCRPSADVTMQAAARVFGARAIGLVMTGMGRDGADGAAAIKSAGGVTLAQDQESSVIFGMPRAAIESGAIDHVVGLDFLAAQLLRIAPT